MRGFDNPLGILAWLAVFLVLAIVVITLAQKI